MFYYSDIVTDIRRLLNDSVTPYRYTDEYLREKSINAVKDIHTKRSDSRTSEDGLSTRPTGSPFSYTVGQYTRNYDRMLGWDRITQVSIFLKQTATAVITIYPTDADRTADTNSLATVASADSVGSKHVAEANSSGWSGSLLITSVAALNVTWDVVSAEQAYELDNIFEDAVKLYTVAVSFDIDSEDKDDDNLSKKFYSQYLNELN